MWERNSLWKSLARLAMEIPRAARCIPPPTRCTIPDIASSCNELRSAIPHDYFFKYTFRHLRQRAREVFRRRAIHLETARNTGYSLCRREALCTTRTGAQRKSAAAGLQTSSRRTLSRSLCLVWGRADEIFCSSGQIPEMM